jgi:hypothetical protein
MHYFNERRPVVITDAIPAKLRRAWGLSSQRKKFGKKTVLVTTQERGWVDTRHTNFHAVHQYLLRRARIHNSNWRWSLDSSPRACLTTRMAGFESKTAHLVVCDF